ncbi:hypothetical protein VHEMI00729 [[Torrubiella] hemipterigena]|uniref:Killer toxin Kp4 domain-containing protein n=1 Tax=[Torrubiella] hemipterigena TaxID=1531966 RepID=A0A0A1SK04_9HYPO|nr:hypothetical protein VHEMI00729 [[Torrubiella] hemipterigena]
MQFSILSIAALISSVAAGGINCNGSGACKANDAKLSDILNQINQIKAQGNGGHNYGTGIQLACADGQYGPICAYYQKGASGTADRAAGLVQDLINHGCKQCGSIPTEPGNDVNKGELTVK